MNYFIVVFSIIFISLAFTVMIHPRVLKNKYFFEKKWLWTISIIRISLGILFLLSSESTSSPTFIKVLGIIIILAGISAPLFSHKKTETFSKWWMNLNEFIIRILGFFALLLGIAIAMAGLPS